MKKIASFMALCIICTGLSVLNASNVMQSVSSDDSTTETVPSWLIKTAVLRITGFSVGNEQSAVNVIVGILTEYEHYGDLSVSSAWKNGVTEAVVTITGHRDYVLGVLDFLSVNKPQYLKIEAQMTL